MYRNDFMRIKRRFSADNLTRSVKLANVSTRCSSHPQGKSEVRCEKAGVFIGVAHTLTHSCSSMFIRINRTSCLVKKLSSSSFTGVITETTYL